jgi:prepilin-type N-terminal cleavage/methylation domain-containing protein
MTPPRDHRARAGFTLIEVIIAMSLLALVATICYSAFQLGIRAVEKGEEAVVTAQRLRAATDVLIRQVKSAVPYAVRNEDEDVYPYFVGTSTSMTFVTGAGQLAGGGLVRVAYRVDDDPPRLVLEESPFFDPDGLGQGTPQPSPPTSSVILDGFLKLSFQYCLDEGGDTGGGGAGNTGTGAGGGEKHGVSDSDKHTRCEWQNSWDGLTEETMPLAVRVLIEGLPGIEEDVWGQEIPIVACAYGEGDCDVNDDQIQECETEAGNDEAGTGGTGTGTGAGKNGGTSGGEDDTDKDDGGDD